MNWKIEIIFTGDYDNYFDENEKEERSDSRYRFKLSIEKIIESTGVLPVTGDWIQPIAKPDYSLNMGRVAGRNFYPGKEMIQFEIE